MCRGYRFISERYRGKERIPTDEITDTKNQAANKYRMWEEHGLWSGFHAFDTPRTCPGRTIFSGGDQDPPGLTGKLTAGDL